MINWWLMINMSQYSPWLQWFKASPEECRKIGHRTSKVPTTAFKNQFLYNYSVDK